MKKTGILVVGGLSTLASIAAPSQAATCNLEVASDDGLKGRNLEEGASEDSLVVKLNDAQREFIRKLTGKESTAIAIEVGDVDVMGANCN